MAETTSLIISILRFISLTLYSFIIASDILPDRPVTVLSEVSFSVLALSRVTSCFESFTKSTSENVLSDFTVPSVFCSLTVTVLLAVLLDRTGERKSYSLLNTFHLSRILSAIRSIRTPEPSTTFSGVRESLTSLSPY